MPGPALSWLGTWRLDRVGRRSRFGFSKVTAVSSTGFAFGAQTYPNLESIELKEVEALTPTAFTKWLRFRTMDFRAFVHELKHVQIIADGEPDSMRENALWRRLGVLVTPGGNEQLVFRVGATDALSSISYRCWDGKRGERPVTTENSSETPRGTRGGLDSPIIRRAPRISGDDVLRAADDLVLEGLRPTIDRIRVRLGRGSPNTIQEHLDTWWTKLGGRLRDIPGQEVRTALMRASTTASVRLSGSLIRMTNRDRRSTNVAM
jgi:hypothetical protein